ncbi:MAG: helix-turn-helix domain-containing protein [Chitinophagaceae bacterium]
MDELELHIKNMVCPRCIKVVRSTLEGKGVALKEVILGKVILEKSLLAKEKDLINQALMEEGFEIIDDQKTRIIEQIKSLIISKVHYQDLSEWKENFSSYLSSQLFREYHFLSQLFSETENFTIEQFIIQQKIEKVKELLVYDELSLSEISFRMGYSSVSHLSGQFKKVTGFTPSSFKRLKDHKRKSLDRL